MKKRSVALALTALCTLLPAALPLQAQNIDNLTPEQQKQLLQLLLLQQKAAEQNKQNGYAPQAAKADAPPPAPAPAAPQLSDAALGTAFSKLPALPQGALFERFRDGFAINGQRYIDAEGTITSYGFDPESGDFTYLAETSPGIFVIKAGRALSNVEPVTIANAYKQGAQWQVTTVTGKKFTGLRLIPSSRGFVIARDNTGFRFVPGVGTTNIVAPETFTIAALQNGDVGHTGYILLERTPESNGSQPGNSLGSLFSAVKSLGSTLGVGKKEDYAMLNIETGRAVPVNVSLEDKQVQVMSACRQRSFLVQQCEKMDSFESAFQPNGTRNMSHYFWRINWFNVHGRPILVSQEGGLSKISATDLNSGKKVILFERTLGIASFATNQAADGRVSVTAQLGFSSETRDDVVALLDSLPDVSDKTAAN